MGTPEARTRLPARPPSRHAGRADHRRADRVDDLDSAAVPRRDDLGLDDRRGDLARHATAAGVAVGQPEAGRCRDDRRVAARAGPAAVARHRHDCRQRRCDRRLGRGAALVHHAGTAPVAGNAARRRNAGGGGVAEARRQSSGRRRGGGGAVRRHGDPVDGEHDARRGLAARAVPAHARHCRRHVCEGRARRPTACCASAATLRANLATAWCGSPHRPSVASRSAWSSRHSCRQRWPASAWRRPACPLRRCSPPWPSSCASPSSARGSCSRPQSAWLYWQGPPGGNRPAALDAGGRHARQRPAPDADDQGRGLADAADVRRRDGRTAGAGRDCRWSLAGDDAEARTRQRSISTDRPVQGDTHGAHDPDAARRRLPGRCSPSPAALDSHARGDPAAARARGRARPRRPAGAAGARGRRHRGRRGVARRRCGRGGGELRPTSS